MANRATCWLQNNGDDPRCLYFPEASSQAMADNGRRLREYCLFCPRFLATLQSDEVSETTLRQVAPVMLQELLHERSQRRQMERALESSRSELYFLHEINQIIQSSLELDEVLAMGLTAITAGQGFGLNRAILLLTDSARQHLDGYLAVGPRSPTDAEYAWQEVEQLGFSLKETGQHFLEQKMLFEKEKFKDLLASFHIPLNDSDHPFIRVLNEQQSRLVHPLDHEPHMPAHQAETLQVKELVVIPLVNRQRRTGVLLADNCITQRPITETDIHSLENFALPLGLAIERAHLYERLKAKLQSLNEANTRLEEQQQYLLRMEKMALVGRLTSHLADVIRNPLTVIGGQSRLLLKHLGPEDTNRQPLEAIARQSRRLEQMLQEALAYAESLHPTLDWWDLNQLVTQVCLEQQEDLKYNNSSYQLDLATDLPLARLDYQKIRYCLASLLHCCMQNQPHGGTIHIRTRRLEEQIVMELEDDGHPLPDQVIQQLDDPFAAPASHSNYLGLSLCYRILQHHNTTLNISTREQGNVYSICFPHAQEENYEPTTSCG